MPVVRPSFVSSYISVFWTTRQAALKEFQDFNNKVLKQQVKYFTFRKIFPIHIRIEQSFSFT